MLEVTRVDDVINCIGQWLCSSFAKHLSECCWKSPYLPFLSESLIPRLKVWVFFLSEADLHAKSSFQESRHAFSFVTDSAKSCAGSLRLYVAVEYHSLHVLSVCFLSYNWLEAGKLLCSWCVKKLCWSTMASKQ